MLNFRLKLVIACAVVLGLPAQAWSQIAYPNRPVRIIVAFPPGQATDQAARAIAQKLSENLGQQFYVENRPGAASIIGSEAAAKSPNDGYTLFMGSSGSLAINPGMYAKLPYDPIRDFTPISLTLKVPFFIVVNPGFPAGTVKELVAYLKANPDKVNFGSAGNGASNHLSAELFKSVAGVSMVHVPYKGSPPAVTDLLGGQIGLMFETGPLVLPHVKNGKLKAIAVGSVQRSSAMPELVTVAESGYPGFEALAWNGVMVPASTPKPIIAKLNGEINAILKQPDVVDKMHASGFDLIGGTPEDFGNLIRRETETWAPVIRKLGLKLG